VRKERNGQRDKVKKWFILILSGQPMLALSFVERKMIKTTIDELLSLNRSNRIKWLFTTYGLRCLLERTPWLRMAFNPTDMGNYRLLYQYALRILFLTTIDFRKIHLKDVCSCKIQPEYTHQSKQE
jgi:hypothetical protein